VKGYIKQALTRKVQVRGPRGKIYVFEEEPSDKLVLTIQFSIAMIICLTILEIAYMVFVGGFSSEIFSVITSLIGTISGVLFAKRV